MRSCKSFFLRRLSVCARIVAVVFTTGSFGRDSQAAIVTWDGGAVNGNWTSALNWVADNAPVANDSLVFDGFARLAPANDFTAGTAFDGLAFAVTAGALNLAGNPVMLHGAIVDNTAVLTQTINLAVVLDATRNVEVTTDGFLAIGGVVSGTGFGLVKTGNGVLTLTGSNTFTGPLKINAGVTSVASDANLVVRRRPQQLPANCCSMEAQCALVRLLH